MSFCSVEKDEAEKVDKQLVLEKEIPVIRDEGTFVHGTGDVYEGWFEARKKERSVKMHGPGTYTTAEGDKYVGIWDNDRLGVQGSVNINYTDGSYYQGLFRDWCYNGLGQYHFIDGTIFASTFSNNIPIGQIVLSDPNEHVWLAKADKGHCWFEPSNHYYMALPKVEDPNAVKKKEGKKGGKKQK